MKFKLINSIKSSYFYFSLFIFVGCTTFDRSFVGLEIFGFRLGELVVGGYVVLSLTLLLLNKKILSEFNLDIFNFEINILKLSIISFLISLFIFNSNILSTYPFKSASYIWFLTSFFIVYSCKSQFINYEKYVKIFSVGYLFMPIAHYLFSTGYYPDFIMYFFMDYSDKFNFTKGSDIMITLLMVNLLFMQTQNKKYLPLLYFSFSVPLMLPLLLEMSRGSFIALVLFFILVIIKNIDFFLKNKIFFLMSLIISFTVFTISTLRISGVDLYQDSYLDLNITENLEKIAKKEDTRKAFFSFYIDDGRLISLDNTTNWRLDIWQDVVYDLKSKNQLLYGYGYNEIIPVMTDPSAPGRLGRDGLNEHVHSYVFNILARGGLLQLILIALFHIKLIHTWFQKNKDFYLLIFVLPVVLNSLTDMNMEGVQFPFMYFYFLGFMFISHKININASLEYSSI